LPTSPGNIATLFSVPDSLRMPIVIFRSLKFEV
jgi:hypothetical protein